MARGVDGRPIFVDDRDRRLFLRLLTIVAGETRANVLSYCLMGNHFHLAIRIGQTPLSKAMHRILTMYAMAFNTRHGRTGHLFQARYKAVVCTHERYLLRLIAYIHDNPVRAGIVSNADSWPWSSALGYRERRRDELINPDLLPSYLGLTTAEQESPFDPWAEEEEPCLFRQEPQKIEPVGNVALACAQELKININELRSKRRDKIHVAARRCLVTKSLQQGISPAEIARWLGCTPAAVHYLSTSSF